MAKFTTKYLVSTKICQESFLEYYLVYKNVRLKFLRPLLKKLENANFRKFQLKFEFFFEIGIA